MTAAPALTAEERAAIAALRRLAAKWPSSLWLFASGHGLHVMRTGPHGEQVTTVEGSFDQSFRVASVDIPNDGGDW